MIGMMGPNVMGGNVAAMNALSRLEPQSGRRGQMFQQFQGQGQGNNNNNNEGLMNSMNPNTTSALFSSVQSQFNPRGSADGMGNGLNSNIIFDSSQVGASSLGMNTMGMTSAEMFEAGLRLERMENRQQQARQQMIMMDMFGRNGHNNGNHSNNNSNTNNGTSSQSFHPPQTTSSGENFGMTGVELSSEIMKRPGMDAVRAFELAKRFNIAT